MKIFPSVLVRFFTFPMPYCEGKTETGKKGSFFDQSA